MARNMVQFQKGLSEPEFERQFGTGAQCRAVVVGSRWPDGFVCPECGGDRHSLVKTRGLFQCSGCRRQTSAIAGTIFASTKLPLRIWFRAIYHLTQTKQGISSIELGRRLGVTQNTAWMVKHKLKQVMMERDAAKQLGGRVEMDDAYIGGERSGGKRGRGAPGKTPFVVAVETTPEGKHQARTGRWFHRQGGCRIRQAQPQRRLHGHQRWSARLLQRERSRLYASGHPHRLGSGGGSDASLQGGQHHLGKHQGGAQRNLPFHQHQACPALPRRVRVSLQSALRSCRHATPTLLGRSSNAANALQVSKVG